MTSPDESHPGFAPGQPNPHDSRYLIGTTDSGVIRLPLRSRHVLPINACQSTPRPNSGFSNKSIVAVRNDNGESRDKSRESRARTFESPGRNESWSRNTEMAVRAAVAVGVLGPSPAVLSPQFCPLPSGPSVDRIPPASTVLPPTTGTRPSMRLRPFARVTVHGTVGKRVDLSAGLFGLTSISADECSPSTSCRRAPACASAFDCGRCGGGVPACV